MPIGLNSLLIENTDTSSVMNNDIEICSFTNSMLGFLTEMNNDFRQANKEYYKAIYESENLVAVNESFADFFEKIKEIIKKFLKYLKSLLDRFITALHRMVGSEKYLLKSEETLKKFNSDHEFDFDGYKFTIEPNIPVCNALVEFNDKFININFGDLAKKSKHDEKKKEIKKVYDEFKRKIDNDEYDKLRAQVINKPGMIYQSEFNNELFELFRDGSDNTSVFTVTNSVVLECFNSIKNYKTAEKDILAKKKEIENQYNTISKQLDHFMTTNRNNSLYTLSIDTTIYDGSNGDVVLDNDAMNQLNLYVKALTNQVTEMTTMHGTAFSYKLDALKDKYAQDKRILYIALNKIQKDKKLRVGEI